ncbi:hypothetical protein QA633_43620 [Bradyrhizobium barranii]|uniref:hypothetical protein n=1 Tax=Bradyrhizobium barranii TaxID=2992140 RepID=UPI0024AFDCFF|nr:hypothetical protein [Bradyrhizobium barranii]WFT95063.1 hypothetical protein QA633_43620 [Bradyrhizobium barranii]
MNDTDTKLAIYDMAIRIMGTPLLPTARTDVPILSPAGKEAADIEALIATAETELLAAIAAKFASLRAAARATSPVAGELPPNAGLDDLVRPMMILRDYVISRAELFRRCVEHPVGTPGGFSLRRDGEGSHLISLSRFDRHFRQYPPRKRRSETEK